MKKLMALFVMLAVAAPMAAGDLSGVWTFDMHVTDGRPVETVIITLKQDGDKLRGNCAAEGELDLTAAGEIHGNSVTWKCTGGDVVATFDATVNDAGSEIKGTWETIVKGTFTATKRR